MPLRFPTQTSQPPFYRYFSFYRPTMKTKMPFIIKSANGARSVNIAKDTNMMADLISLIKGITFKVEIKITDIKSEFNETAPSVVKPNQTASLEASSRSKVNGTNAKLAATEPEPLIPKAQGVPTEPKTIETPSEPKAEQAPPKPKLTSAPPVPKVTEALSKLKVTEAPPKPKLAEELPKPKGTEAPPRSKLVEDPPKPKVAEAVPEQKVSEPPRISRSYEAPHDNLLMRRIARPPKREVSPLIRGKIEIGSVLETCCIAVDDRGPKPLAYISYDDVKLMKIVDIIASMGDSIQALPEMASVKVNDIVFAKSIEDNIWYRSVVEKVNGDQIDIFFFDWGLRETTSSSRIRLMCEPELGLSNFPACAIKVKFTDTPQSLQDKVLQCETAYKLEVVSYDDSDEMYAVKALSD